MTTDTPTPDPFTGWRDRLRQALEMAGADPRAADQFPENLTERHDAPLWEFLALCRREGVSIDYVVLGHGAPLS